MLIGICGIDKEIKNRLNDVCKKVFLKYGMDYKIRCLEDGFNFDETEYNIIILDVDKLQKSSIELKEEYQFKQSDMLIIFIANNYDLIAEAFGRNVIGFLNKTNLENDLEICMDKAVRIVKKKVVICGYNSKNIVYITHAGDYCIIKVKGIEKNIFFRCTMYRMEKLLIGTPLVKVHKSYIVNMEYVDSTDDGIVRIGDVRIPVSLRNRRVVDKNIGIIAKENDDYSKNSSIIAKLLTSYLFVVTILL